MDVTKPYDFIGFGAMDVTKPYEFIGFGPAGRWQPSTRGVRGARAPQNEAGGSGGATAPPQGWMPVWDKQDPTGVCEIHARRNPMNL